jgi:hypothetical protein
MTVAAAILIATVSAVVFASIYNQSVRLVTVTIGWHVGVSAIAVATGILVLAAVGFIIPNLVLRVVTTVFRFFEQPSRAGSEYSSFALLVFGLALCVLLGARTGGLVHDIAEAGAIVVGYLLLFNTIRAMDTHIPTSRVILAGAVILTGAASGLAFVLFAVLLPHYAILSLLAGGLWAVVVAFFGILWISQRRYRLRLLAGRRPLTDTEIAAAMYAGSGLGADALLAAWSEVAEIARIDPRLMRPNDTLSELCGVHTWYDGWGSCMRDTSVLLDHIQAAVQQGAPLPDHLATVDDVVRTLARATRPAAQPAPELAKTARA